MPSALRYLPALALLATLVAYAGDASKPPASPAQPASSTLHGVVVNDPYRWLEDPDAAAVKTWIQALPSRA